MKNESFVNGPWAVCEPQDGDGQRVFIKDKNGFVVAECSGSGDREDNLRIAEWIVETTNEKAKPEDSDENNREFLTPEEAEALLVDGETVHCFIPSGPALIGADWERDSVIGLLKSADSVEKSGPTASSMKHGIAAIKKGKIYFFETKGDDENGES